MSPEEFLWFPCDVGGIALRPHNIPTGLSTSKVF